MKCNVLLFSICRATHVHGIQQRRNVCCLLQGQGEAQGEIPAALRAAIGSSEFNEERQQAWLQWLGVYRARLGEDGMSDSERQAMQVSRHQGVASAGGFSLASQRPFQRPGTECVA